MHAEIRQSAGPAFFKQHPTSIFFSFSPPTILPLVYRRIPLEQPRLAPTDIISVDITPKGVDNIVSNKHLMMRSKYPSKLSVVTGSLFASNHCFMRILGLLPTADVLILEVARSSHNKLIYHGSPTHIT